MYGFFLIEELFSSCLCLSFQTGTALVSTHFIEFLGGFLLFKKSPLPGPFRLQPHNMRSLQASLLNMHLVPAILDLECNILLLFWLEMEDSTGVSDVSITEMRMREACFPVRARANRYTHAQ